MADGILDLLFAHPLPSHTPHPILQLTHSLALPWLTTAACRWQLYGQRVNRHQRHKGPPTSAKQRHRVSRRTLRHVPRDWPSCQPPRCLSLALPWLPILLVRFSFVSAVVSRHASVCQRELLLLATYPAHLWRLALSCLALIIVDVMQTENRKFPPRALPRMRLRSGLRGSASTPTSTRARSRSSKRRSPLMERAYLASRRPSANSFACRWDYNQLSAWGCISSSMNV